MPFNANNTDSRSPSLPSPPPNQHNKPVQLQSNRINQVPFHNGKLSCKVEKAWKSYIIQNITSKRPSMQSKQSIHPLSQPSTHRNLCNNSTDRLQPSVGNPSQLLSHDASLPYIRLTATHSTLPCCVWRKGGISTMHLHVHNDQLSTYGIHLCRRWHIQLCRFCGEKHHLISEKHACGAFKTRATLQPFRSRPPLRNARSACERR